MIHNPKKSKAKEKEASHEIGEMRSWKRTNPGEIGIGIDRENEIGTGVGMTKGIDAVRMGVEEVEVEMVGT